MNSFSTSHDTQVCLSLFALLTPQNTGQRISMQVIEQGNYLLRLPSLPYFPLRSFCFVSFCFYFSYLALLLLFLLLLNYICFYLCVLHLGTIDRDNEGECKIILMRIIVINMVIIIIIVMIIIMMIIISSKNDENAINNIGYKIVINNDHNNNNSNKNDDDTDDNGNGVMIKMMIMIRIRMMIMMMISMTGIKIII